MGQGSLFFEERGAVHESLARITQRLDELGISYALADGMALFAHGYRRFTEDVDILVTRDGLNRIHQELEGRGYVRPFERSKNLRDADTKVKIEFLVTGSYPGDGRPKAIAFPDPATAADLKSGFRVLKLDQLIALKLASGMTGDGRTKDLADVEQLIQLLQLPESLAESLHSYVREKYLDIWGKLHATTKRYVLLWRHLGITDEAHSIDDMIRVLGNSADELRAMRDAGVTLDDSGSHSEAFARLVTTDPVVAAQFGFADESEYWDAEADESAGGDAPSAPN